MESENNTFLTKLPAEENSGHIILHTIWGTQSIRFQVLDLTTSQNNEWCGDLLVEDLKTSATELSIPFEDFYSESKRALTNDKGLENFSYNIEDGKFVWRKKEKFKVVYGEVHLVPTQNLKDRLIVDSIGLINKLTTSYQKLRFEFQEQSVEFERYAESYRECVAEKNSLEKNLFTKFCVLLNSKKDKIAELQQIFFESNSRYPNGTNDNGTRDNPDQQNADFVSQSNTNSKRKGLLLPKRNRKRAIQEAAATIQGDNEREKPGCSRIPSENTETSNFDDIFDDL